MPLAIAHQDYTWTGLSTSGIYFDQVGDLNMVESHWNLVTFIDLNLYFKKFGIVQDALNNAEKLCFNNKRCDPTLYILKHKFVNLDNQKTTLVNLLSLGNHRAKRAWLNIIGSAFKTIFGTLTEDDAQYYTEAINNVNKDEKQLFEMLKQQTQIVKSAITNFNQTITNLDVNEVLFDKNFKKLQSYFEEVNKNLNDAHITAELNEHLDYVMLIVNELDNEFNLLINSLLFSRNNIVHPHVITPKQLLNELLLSVPHLPNSMSYPIPLNIHNIEKIVKLLKLNVFFANDRIIFVMKFPLITFINFNIFEIVSVPIKRKDDFYVFILPTSRYLALSEAKSQYILLEDLKKCNNIDKDKFICDDKKPLYSITNRNICEIEIIMKQDILPSNCDVRILKNFDELWHKLHNNKWLTILPKTTLLTFKCSNEKPFDVYLKNTGIMTIKPGCKIFTGSSVITNTDDINSQQNITSYSFSPKFILNENCCNDLNISQSILEFPTLYSKLNDLSRDNLNVASHRLDDILSKISDKQNESTMNKIINSSYFSYFIIGFLKLIFIYVCYKIIRKFYVNFKPNGESPCTTIYNYVTLNSCRKKIHTEVNDPVDLEELPSSPMLRRSTRLRTGIN
jgi:hypothetical protein